MADLTITATSVVAVAGAKTASRVAGASLTAGQVLFKDATDVDKMKLADSNDASAAKRVFGGIALNNAGSGQPVVVITEGDVTIGATLTKGTAYYLSQTPGGICPFADLTTGALPVLLGMAISTTVLRLKPISADSVL